MNNEKKFMELNLDDVLPNRFQPRIKFNEKGINELAESIKKHGVIEPIVVRTIGDKYEIIAGERRYKASVMAGKETIPAIISNLNDRDSAEVALIENVQRQNLTPIEEAVSYKKILDMGYMTQSQLAEKLGKEQSTVANKLRLLQLSEDVQEALLNEKISERHARSLLRLPQNMQREMLERIVEERMTVRKTDEEIDNFLANHKGVEIIDFEETEAKDNNVVETQNPKIEINTINPGFIDVDKIETEAKDIFEQKKEPQVNFIKEKKEIDEEPQGMFFTPQTEEKDIEETENIQNEAHLFNSSLNDSTVEQKNIEHPFFPINEKKSTYVTSELKTVINTLRDSTKTIEKYGFKVVVEEFDFEDMYQFIVKINKE